jgi:hypothetical protein
MSFRTIKCLVPTSRSTLERKNQSYAKDWVGGKQFILYSSSAATAPCKVSPPLDVSPRNEPRRWSARGDEKLCTRRPHSPILPSGVRSGAGTTQLPVNGIHSHCDRGCSTLQSGCRSWYGVGHGSGSVMVGSCREHSIRTHRLTNRFESNICKAPRSVYLSLSLSLSDETLSFAPRQRRCFSPPWSDRFGQGFVDWYGQRRLDDHARCQYDRAG